MIDSSGKAVISGSEGLSPCPEETVAGQAGDAPHFPLVIEVLRMWVEGWETADGP